MSIELFACSIQVAFNRIGTKIRIPSILLKKVIQYLTVGLIYFATIRTYVRFNLAGSIINCIPMNLESPMSPKKALLLIIISCIYQFTVCLLLFCFLSVFINMWVVHQQPGMAVG
jgi:hypothetical protein